jgi:hypothetical protein
MRVGIHHHQRKAVALAEALVAHGHELVAGGPADAFLIDADREYHRPIIDDWIKRGAKAFVYPHGAPADVTHDIVAAYERVTGAFVYGEGQAEVLRRIEYPNETYTIGWFYSPQQPFRGDGRVRNVLFAPAHPLQSGLLVDVFRQHNHDAFAALLAVPGIRITVRHVQGVEANGLWHEPGVEYVRGAEDNAYEQIDAADVVVGFYGTFPTMAVARGCPTVFYGGDMRFSDIEHGGEPRYAARQDRYHDYLRYPVDLADGPAAEQLERAAAGEQTDWRRRFVGPEWNPSRFVALMEEAVAGTRPDDLRHLELRGLVVAADAREAIARPELLAGYAQRVALDADATLLLHAPGGDAEVLAEELELALASVGLSTDALPDALLEVGLGVTTDAGVARGAHAVLGDGRPAWADLPRYGAADLDALAARVR